MVALLDPGRHGPDLPERPGPEPGRPAPSGHRRLRLPGEQPGEEGGERLRGGVHPMGGAGAAGLAPPSLAPGAGPAVSPRLSAAEGTGLRVHRMPPSSRTSSTVSAWTSWPNARLRTHFLSCNPQNNKIASNDIVREQYRRLYAPLNASIYQVSNLLRHRKDWHIIQYYST